MFEIQIVDQYSLYTHFLELTAPYFPLKNFQIKDKIGTLNVQFNNQVTYQPLLYIYILSTNSYEGYKNIARARLMRYFEDYPQRNSIILFFPSLLRVDDKVNKILLQTHDLICQDLQIIKQFPKERVQKIIFYDPDRELNKEQCVREFLYCFQQQVQILVEHQLDILDDQIYDQEQQIHEKAFSFYKFYAIKEKKAQIYENLGLKQEALDIYIGYEQFFLAQYPKSIQPIFNAIHPFDFLAKKSIELNIKNFEESGDESQSTVLDFLVLIQYRIIDLISGGNQIFGVEKILSFNEQIKEVVQQQIRVNQERQQFHADEEELWNLGLLIWQFFNMRQSLVLMAQVPQNLTQDLQLATQQSQLKIRFALLEIVEKLGFTLYNIQFNSVRSMSLPLQCQLLEETILEQSNNIVVKDQTITRTLDLEPKELFRTYLLSDNKLKGQLNTLENFSAFYCQTIKDIISVASQLNLNRVIFEYQFIILKLKNIYPQLVIAQEIIEQSLKHTKSDFQNLHSSLLVQKLIYFYREKMELSFQDCFKDALISNLPGSRYTRLFKILQIPLTKLKNSYIGYFEMFYVKKRLSYTDFIFKFQILKYLQVQCDGVFKITLKIRGGGLKDRRKLKLVSDLKELREEKKVSFEFQQHLSINQGGLYAIKKVSFQSGSFKLYFDVSEKVQQLKVHLMHPQIHTQNSLTITNCGTPLLFSVSDLPQAEKYFELTLVTRIKIAAELKTLQGATIVQDKNHFKVTVDDEFLIQQPFILFLYAFEEYENQNLKLVINIKNHQFATDLKISAKNMLEIQDMSDKIDDEFELYELTNISHSQLNIQNADKVHVLKHMDGLRQMVEKGQQIFVNQTHNFKEAFSKNDFLDEAHYEELETIFSETQSIQKILQVKRNLYDIYQLQQKQILFKVSLLSLFHQEQGTPYKQSDYFDIVAKIQYTGVEEGQFQFELASHHPTQSRKWKEYLSPEKTINLTVIKCFLTGREDFEKPTLKIQLIKNEKIYEIDEKYMEVEFQLKINEQQ